MIYESKLLYGMEVWVIGSNLWYSGELL